MTILDQLQEASYNGAVFLITGSSTTGGRKTVTHEYPNSGKRFVEDMGGLQKTFSINGTISGDNYFADRDALQEELEKGGEGQLSHPFYGTIKVVLKTYTVTEDTRSLGRADFSMTFEKVDEKNNQFPTQSSSKVSIINRYRSTLFGLTSRDLVNQFKVSRTSPQNYLDALTTLSTITGAFSVNSDTVTLVTSEINSFNSALSTFQDNQYANIFNSTQLASNLNDVFNSYGQIGNTPENQLKLTQRLFDFGADRAPVMPTTVERIARIENRDIINSVMRANALVQAYNTVTSLSLGNTEEIDTLSKTLEAQFEYVLNENTLEGDTVANIKNMRVQVREYLDQQRATAPRIATITTKEIPMTILAYQYYGSTDNTQELIDLNSELDPTFVEGSVRILTA